MKSKSLISKAFTEVYKNKPRTLNKKASKPMQRKQLIAIALSKARSAGAHIRPGQTK